MEEREETRKIQFTGKSSYIVSLPKQWVVDGGLAITPYFLGMFYFSVKFEQNKE